MTHRAPRVLVIAVAAAAIAGADPVSAQSAGSGSGSTLSGWILTPSVTYSSGWDDNVLIKGEGDEAVGDLLNVVNPRADIGFNGRRGQFGASYDGAFLLYGDLSDLNSYDQHASVSARRRLSPHVTLFARNGFAQVPTTQTVELVGVPFLRTGSTVDDVQAGVEAALSKRTRMTATYDFQWVDFDEDPAFTTVLRGGRSHGGSVSLRRVLSSRTSAVADYRLQHALVSDVDEVFTVHNASAGLDHRVTELVHVFMMVGVSHLSVNAFGPPRTGPSVQAGLSRQFQAASAALTYGRSFIPSYGFGGTMQNEELTAHLHLPLSRRLSQQSSVAWRRNQPLTAGELPLTSFWIEVAVGYALHPSVRMQAFYAGAHQVIERAGGVTNQNRMGVQLVASKPLRMR